MAKRPYNLIAHKVEAGALAKAFAFVFKIYWIYVYVYGCFACTYVCICTT